MTVKLSVELCGRLADACGRKVDVELPQGEAPVRDLFVALGKTYPPLGQAIASGRVRACVNEVLVTPEAIVRPGDEVALFPPVSGG